MESDLGRWFEGQTVLLTGGTGFLGKVVAEKLLRSTQLSRLYLLVRPKKGKDVQQRTDDLLADPVFERVRNEVPDYRDLVSVVEGDVTLDSLGMSELDTLAITQQVTTVIHGAATVKFDEKLKTAVDINVTGTKRILMLCKQIANLKSVVHVSTAFAYCVHKEIEEKFYNAPISGDNLIQLVQCLNENQLEAITTYILDSWPNTYAFTKAVAEETVKTHGKGLPIVVFRPAIVMGAMDEPVKGWIDNVYGPTGVVVAVSAGLMRALHADPASVADVVPVDLTANAVLTSARHAHTNKSPEIPVFNFVSSAKNPVTWGELTKHYFKWGMESPPSRHVWYPTLTITPSRLYFQVCALLYHILPALLVDGLLLIRQKKPRALKVYNKIHKFAGVLSFFSTRTWKFGNENVERLLREQSEADSREFNFDIATVKWSEFFRVNFLGVRQFIFNDSAESIPGALKKLFWLRIFHYTILVVTYSMVGWLLWKCSTFLLKI